LRRLQAARYSGYAAIFEDALMKDRYGVTPSLLHWLLALLVFTLYGLGWYMVNIPKGTPPVAYFYNLHKSIGIVAALPVALLLWWRATHEPPPLPGTLAAWEARVAHINHILFYVCLIVLVVSGFIESNFTKFGIRFFGYPLPRLGWEDRTIYQVFNTVHVYVSHFFVVLIAIHVGAALKHLLVDRDQVFQRMIPARSRT
jgi:cytochrome b561